MSNLLGLALSLAGWIIGIEISIAQVVILFKLHDKKKAELSDLFAFFQARLLARYFLISFLYGLLVSVGLLFFIVPGIYFGIKYGFAAYIFVDKKTGIFESFRKSAQLTRGVKWQLLGFGVLGLLIVIAGSLVFLVGLLAALPVVYMAQIYIYRQLSAHRSSR